MKNVSFRRPPSERRDVHERAGVTLLEILIMILILSVGLVTVLELIPVGALEIAKAVKDDRAGTIAAEAQALSEAGQEVLAQTEEFAANAWTGKVDHQQAAMLKAKYQELADAATIIELQLLELRPTVPKPFVRMKVEILLAQIRSIERNVQTMTYLFGMLEEWTPATD